MKVSIVTTCFNREKTIRDTIESVLSQSYPNIEYIVVDGASTDGTMSIVNEYRTRLSDVVSEKDSGMYEAINKGIRRCTGDIVGLLHSDDVLYSADTISHVVDYFRSKASDLIYGNGIFVDPANWNKVVRDWVSGPFAVSRLYFGWLPLHPTVFIRREWFDVLGMYNESYKISADSDFLLRYLSSDYLRINYIDEYIVKMRMGGLSTDVSKTKQKWNEDIKLYKAHGMNPYSSLFCKVASKVPQFIKAKLF